jgi:hypothetical protein
MATFEEELVKAYYNLEKYFTIENIPFKPKEKKKGGKGKGEIDLLGIKIDKDSGRVEDAICVEVSTSLVDHFPFSKGDEKSGTGKILERFFEKDIDEKLKDYCPPEKFNFIFVTSPFKKNVYEELEKRLKPKVEEFEILNREERALELDPISVRIKHNGKKKRVKIIPITWFIKELKNKMKKKTDYFPSHILRAIQWFEKYHKEVDEKERRNNL